MSTYHLASPIPIPIYPAGNAQGLDLINTGRSTVYVGNTASGINGFPITPGNKIQWHAREPLYAYVTDGTDSILTVLSAGTVSGITVVGEVQEGQSGNSSWIATIENPDTTTAVFGTSNYRTLWLRVETDSNAIDVARVDVYQYATAAGILVMAQDTYYAPASTDDYPHAVIRVPVKAPFSKIVMSNVGGSDVQAWTTYVYGSADNVSESYYQSGCDFEGFNIDHARELQANIDIASISSGNWTDWYPGTWAGRVMLNVELYDASTGTIYINIYTYDFRNVFFTTIDGPVSGGDSFQWEFLLPRAPVYVYISNEMAAAMGMSLNLTYQPIGAA